MINRKVIVTTLASILTIGMVSGAVALTTSIPQQTGADTTPITNQLDSQSKELANHEARITNNESNIQSVADKTGTTTTVVQVPAPDPVDPTISTPQTLPPVTTISYEMLAADSNGSQDCKYNYSDGTSYQWHWKVEQGNTITKSGVCSDLVIGQPKLN